jgi:hypothetical protein
MSATATSSREELLTKVRERLTTRLAAVEKDGRQLNLLARLLENETMPLSCASVWLL